MNKGGYSGIGMLPVYAGFTTLLIAIMPVLGPVVSFILVLFGSMFTAVITVKYFRRERITDHEAYYNAIYEMQSTHDYVKNTSDYRVTTPSRFDAWRESKKSKKTVTKRNLFYIPRALRHSS